MKKYFTFKSIFVLFGFLLISPLSLALAQTPEPEPVQPTKVVVPISNVKFLSAEEVKNISTKCENDKNPDVCTLKLVQPLDVEARRLRVMEGIGASTVVLPRPANPEMNERSLENSIRNILLHVSNIINRGFFALNKFDNIADRVDSRIEKMETGIDSDSRNLSEVKKMVAEARVKIISARGSLEKISASYEDVILKGSPQAFFAEMRAVISELKEIQSLLSGAVSSLKNL